MSNKTPAVKYVTEIVFKKEINGLHQKIDNVTHDIGRVKNTMATKNDIGKLALAIDRHERDLQIMKETMATKNDVRSILDHIDAFTKKVSLFEQEEGIQSIHLTEVKQQVDDHEKRLTVLESSR